MLNLNRNSSVHLQTPKKALVLSITFLMIAAMMVPIVRCDVTGVVITAPTTSSPVHVLPGGTVSITYEVSVDRLDQVIDVQVTFGPTTVAETTVNPPVVPAPIPSSPVTRTTNVVLPATVAPGTYDVRIRARQPSTGQWDVTVFSYSSVIVDSPPPSDTTPPVITHVISGTLGNNGWYTSDVIVTFTAADDESTITSQGLTSPITSSANSYTVDYDTTGVTITYSATSSGGTATDSVTIKRDATKPTLTKVLAGTKGNDPWYISDVTVTLTGGDATSGLDKVEYSYDGTTWVTYSAPFKITTEGTTNLYHKATDKAGNVYELTAQEIRVDKTAPLTSDNYDGLWHKVDITITLTATDATSGVAETYYKINGGATQTVGADGQPQITTESATNSLEYWSVDVAGNVEDHHTLSNIKLDKTNPVVTTNVADFGSYPEGATGFVLTFSASDSLSGVAELIGELTDYSGTRSVTSGVALQQGVYSLYLKAVDNAGNVAEGTIFFVVYDPSAGFVTGGGWINSPAGALTSDPTLTGKATFGFVSKYKKGANVPEGNTEFQFHAAGLNFKSVDYQWLVVSGARAQFKGTGTINGIGSYGFMLTVVDGQVKGGGGSDAFRIKIWDLSKDANDPNYIVYDSGLGAADTGNPTLTLGGGSIQIQAK